MPCSSWTFGGKEHVPFSSIFQFCSSSDTLRHLIIKLLVFTDNLALEKPAFQSSLYSDAKDANHPRKAVDGVKNTDRYHCANTQFFLLNPFWRVDLEQVLPVSEVFILNSGDCCGEHLNGTEIRVGRYSK